MPKRNRDRVNLFPHLRFGRLCDFRELGLHALQHPQTMQEFPVAFDADHVGLLCRTDIRRVYEDLRHCEYAALAVEVPNRLMADGDRPASVELAFERNLAGVERHRGGEALEGRAHLVKARRHAVQMVLVQCVYWIVRIEVRHRGHREYFARLDVQDHGAGGNGVIAQHTLINLVAQDVLDAQID